MKQTLSIALVIACLVAPVPAAPTDDADRAAMLKGVSAVNTGGLPGGVTAFGPNAFPLVAGKDGKNALLPIAAAARWQKGRIVVFGHDGFLKPEKTADNGALLPNIARWAAGDKAKPKIGILKNEPLMEHLKAAGFDTVALDDKEWATKISRLDVVFVAPFWISNDDIAPLEKFIQSGGGLVAGATGWGWVQIFRKENAQLAGEYPGNLLLQKAGLAFTAGTPDKTLPQGFSTGGNLTLLNATTALDALASGRMGKEKLDPPALAQCAATLSDAIRSISPEDKILLPKIATLGGKGSPVPTEAKPVRSSDALGRLMLTRDLELLRNTKPEQISPHPAAEVFPGPVPKSAPRVSRTLDIDAAVPQWHSTGLYAAPGEVIRITIPRETAGKGLSVRIGCHSDTLWHLDDWKRVPEISRREPLKEPQSSVASPFGGLIYIDIPEKAPHVTIQVTISGAVEAPHFVLGKTKVTDWKKTLRDHPAPWAELETGKVILSVPSAKIRRLENPDELLTLWDKILDAEADLSAIPRERKRPERIVPDVQISAGYMHSGYPIMTWLDHSVEQSLSTRELGAGSWGHFHELGHNHQKGDWTFDGTVEVTCNLYSLYVSETVCKLPPGTGHDAMNPPEVAKRLKAYLALPDSEKFSVWKSDPFLALTMYDQLRAGFGWDTYKKVFAEYLALPDSERPKNDDGKRDQWLTRFSRAAGKNLGPFFQAWGVPTSEAARNSIAGLPTWMPEDWGK
ncbi:hypothetical protein JIN84_13625 [Luteolibacter yonseiensis]|uniref:Peptidase M60 domain-containing protein n=1 Tax=Luteolibacter yonseiensis TaxID=1144680 RepID=A0A934R747_9BACT|nr:M60 family metallopeptidase [Luteolibacter yonseiensis]MBK1816660.1 hypothetical protein [Luteolibacter yonseiensis]